MQGTHQLMAKLIYGCGLRVMECIRLRVKDIDFAMNQIVVRDGKGKKDRVTVLPDGVKPALIEHLVYVKMIYTHVLNRGGKGVRSPLDFTAELKGA
jgi:site-specific recombinase XerD